MVLFAFLVGVALVAAGATVAVVRGLELWRQTKRTGATLTPRLSTFEDKAEYAQRHLAAFEQSSSELERALARLRESRARLQVLLAALERSKARVRWLRVFLPG